MLVRMRGDVCVAAPRHRLGIELGMGSLIDDLRRPDAYGAGVVEPIELIATHVSWVFLTAHEVFKVKRPVDLGFLDFTTQEARRRACEAEVVLNRRLARDVYIGVVPIRRTTNGVHTLVGDGPVVDWAVRMRRLPDAERADEMLARGALTGEAIDRLASCLAAFHARARCDDETARFGRSDVIRSNVEENFAQTRGTIEQHIAPAQARAIERFQRTFLDRGEALLDARIAAGRVRDGHGDIRLEHVYLGRDGNVTVIDCIEFNDRFRYADVCADLAFLSMDLAWHGRVDLAERLLARYARDADDFDLYAVADFYESYRAYVRGKISAMLAADLDAPADARDRGAREARRYYLLALVAERRALLAPCVVAVGGVIASGKSTIADAIGLELGAPVVDADRTRKHLVGVAPTTQLRDGAWRGAYDRETTEHVYAEVLRRAEVVLSSGRPVVIDASFRSAAHRAAARALAASHGVPFHFVECKASPDVCRARLRQRESEGAVSDGRLEIFDAFCARFEAVDEIAPAEHLVLDTTQPLDVTLATLRSALDVWPRGMVA